MIGNRYTNVPILVLFTEIRFLFRGHRTLFELIISSLAFLPSKESKCPPPGYEIDPSKIIEKEESHILRGRNESDDRRAMFGLAISGGGIRSASFATGVMQALVSGDVLHKVDYLSTVSGGGYIGSSLTWFLNRGLPDGQPAGTEAKNFPFGAAQAGGRSNTNKDRNAILNFIRQHGKYMTPGKGLDIVSLVTVVVRSMVASLFIYGGLLTGAMIGLEYSGAFVPLSDTAPNPLLASAAAIGVAFLIWSVVYSVATSISNSTSRHPYQSRTAAQRWSGRAWWVAGALALVGVLPDAVKSIGALIDTTLAAGVLTSLGGLAGFFQAKSEQSDDKPNELMSSLRVAGGVFALIFGVLVGAYVIAAAIHAAEWRWWSALVVGGIALIVGVVSNINHVGLHRMYRDRLMETFLPNFENVRENSWGLATEADSQLISDMCASDSNPRPYHLVNTNVVLVDSPESKYRGRGGDSFILSPLYCGSDATGWRESDKYLKNHGRGMTLATAMAISGAAANPNTGVGGKGVTRGRLVSVLMSLLNIRLGYWAANPNPEVSSFQLPPNFIYPGLRSWTFGNHKEDSFAVELSDGGHFENLALYELVRRQVRIILVADGGCDQGFTFGDLANATERVRVDFGVKISFDDPRYDLRWLQPGSADEQNGFLNEKYNLAKRGFAIATIRYPHAPDGTLIYLKTTMTLGLPTDIYGYKSAHESFPDESTADQFFDEDQFEAYRELGYYIGWQFLEANQAGGTPPASGAPEIPWI